MNGATKAKANGRSRGNQVPRRKSGATEAYIIPAATDSGKRAALAIKGRDKRAGKQKLKPKPKAEPRYPPLQRSFLTHVRASKRPFDGEKVLPFHTYNPEPTLIATPGFASSLYSIDIPAGHNLWLAVGSTNNVKVESEYYGRTYSPLINTSSGVASTTVCGPLQYTGFHAAAIAYGQLSTETSYYTALNPPVGSAFAFTPSTSFPVPASSGSGTIRWVPIVWGVRIRRVSKLVDSAGSWHTALPPNRMGLAATITDLDLRDIGSYKLGTSEGGEWSVPARPADLAYSRCDYNSVEVDFHFTDPAFLAYYHNGTDSTATYEIEICLKYAVGGKSINAIGIPVDHAPQHANVLEAASAAITSGVVPGHAGETVAKLAHAALSTGTSVLSAVQKAAKLDFSFADDLTKL